MTEEQSDLRGVSPEAASQLGRKALGGSGRARVHREAEVTHQLESLLQDLRFAVRQLRKKLGFACTAVMVFAFGIAVSTAIFAFVNTTLVRPLPSAPR